jgi:predicted amidophosphoribosyltransferase
VDPELGKSAWRRGVLREHQVLVCPVCQPAAESDLDRCARCGSVHLIRRLDQVECLDCRLIRDAGPPQELASRDPTLADEVARALDRVLGRR